MLETRGEFLVKRWGFTILAILLALYGTISILTQESYLPQGFRGGNRGFGKVYGLQAIFAGIAYLGIGIAIFGNFVLPYSDRFFRWERPVFVSGLIATMVAIILIIWRFIYRA